MISDLQVVSTRKCFRYLKSPLLLLSRKVHYFPESFTTDCSECYNYLLQIITPSSCFWLAQLETSFVLSHLSVMSLFVRPLELHAERSIFGGWEVHFWSYCFARFSSPPLLDKKEKRKAIRLQILTLKPWLEGMSNDLQLGTSSTLLKLPFALFENFELTHTPRTHHTIPIGLYVKQTFLPFLPAVAGGIFIEEW